MPRRSNVARASFSPTPKLADDLLGVASFPVLVLDQVLGS
jgi:hypothetical protein